MKKKRFLPVLISLLMILPLCLKAEASGLDLGALLGDADASSLIEMLTGSGSSSGSNASSPLGETGMELLMGMLGMSGRAMKECTVSDIPDQTYTGKAITPSPVVRYKGTRLKKGTDFTVSYSSNTRVGTAKITLRGKGSYTGTKTVSFKIVRKNGSASKSASKKKSTAGSSAKTKHFTVKLATQSYVYNGKERRPDVKVTVSGKTVTKSNYSVTYRNNKSVGKATVTVKGKGEYKGYSGEGTFKIVLKKTSLKSASSSGEGQISCKWNADRQADGYQIGYATNKSFSSGKILKVSGGAKKTVDLTKLAAGKTWYVRIRSFKKVGSSNWYSDWSAAKSVKVK